MASLPPTPYDVFGPSPFSGQELLGPSLAGDLIGGGNIAPPPMPTTSLAQERPFAPPEPGAIDKLRPNSELHTKVITKLDAMLKFSEGEMKKHYYRWNFMESKVQAFIQGQDYQRLLESMEDSYLPPEPIQVVVPYTYATLHAAATYISNVLLGRKPVFSLNAARGSAADQARLMEQALQYQLDESQGQEGLWQHVWDGLVYSFNAVGISWQEINGMQLRMQGGQRIMEEGLVFAGNKLEAHDPYRTYPDPRVPLHKCSQLGDFIFTSKDMSKTVLKDLENAGALKWIDAACYGQGQNEPAVVESRRRIRIGEPSTDWLRPNNVVGFHTIHEGTVRLVPKDWGLGDSTSSELWKFSWVKNKQIIQAEPLNMIHRQHPYAIQEPNSLGHDFMSLSLGEMITVFQDILSWQISSRMENVRAAINNTFVVDPSRVEINDIRQGPIGRLIRLKKSASGLPIDEAIKQLAITDVTGGHLADLQMTRLLADTTTGVNDNLRGIQTQGGRRSATEARMSMQAGASRLSQLAIRISSQSMSQMAKQMVMNTQQFMPNEMWIEISGDKGMESKLLTPDMLIGSFNHQITDGSLPMDKAAMVEVWKEILFGIARDPELRQRFDLAEIFKYTAELGGAKNIDSFERQTPQLPQIANPGEEPDGQAIGSAVPSVPAGQVF